MFFVVISVFILLLYCTLVLIFIVGFKRIGYFKNDSAKIDCRATVIVACKNEENHLPDLFCALQNQTFTDFDLIFVNDHSTDQTENLLLSFKNKVAGVKVLNATGYGKKNAVKEAIFATTTEFVVTTDADCVPVPTWLETLCRYQTLCPSDLIICPVSIKEGKGFFHKLQQLEFATLVGSGAGMVGVGMPIMCNAANMAFRKSEWIESQFELHEELLSGDDVFLLTSIKKRKGQIRFLKSLKALVETAASPDINSFLKQRRRWASKSTKYNDSQLILTAIIVFGVNLNLVLLFSLSFFELHYLYLFFLVYFLKLFFDFVFCKDIYKFLSSPLSVIYVIVLSVIYPFYIVFTSISSLFWHPKSW